MKTTPKNRKKERKLKKQKKVKKVEFIDKIQEQRKGCIEKQKEAKKKFAIQWSNKGFKR